MDFFGTLISAIVRSKSLNMQKVAENMEGRQRQLLLTVGYKESLKINILDLS